MVEVKQADREAAWEYADFHCLPDRQMHERWFSGYYDNFPQGHAIQAFALHREAAIAEATAAKDAEIAKLRRKIAANQAMQDADHAIAQKLIAENEALSAKLADATLSLEVYADGDNFWQLHLDGHPPCEFDQGKLARQTLDRIREKNNV